MRKESIALIGGGPAALFFAAFVNTDKYEVSIYEKKKQGARKFLVAGKGGFNLTHSEPMVDFIQRYTPSSFLEDALHHFTNKDLRKFLTEIGIPTMIGSSKRVYPVDTIKPIEVLNALLDFLGQKGVQIHNEWDWTGWNANNELVFANEKTVQADHVIFALGGGSWEVTGSDGTWLESFKNKGVKVHPFQPSNCAFQVNWSKSLISQLEGEPLKNCHYSAGRRTQKGEAVITKFGIEGNGIYALSPEIRTQLKQKGEAIVEIDFKPTWAKKKILEVMANSRLTKMTDILKKEIRLTKVQINLLKQQTSKDEFLSKEFMAHLIKIFPLKIVGTAPLDEAISTVGGVSLSAIDANYQLLEIPHHYCIGEMLDYDAPTGGYLLQSCFSMGAHLASKFA